jgi:hypothetical protein
VTTLPLIPNAEAIVGDYLREHPDIVALDAHVAGTGPSDTKRPWVRVTQLDDPAVDEISDHLIEYMLQLDCYAGGAAMEAHSGQSEASLLSRTVRAVLKEMEAETVGGAVVAGVRFVSNPRIPDEAFKPARERFARTVIVWMHAA